MNKSSTSDVKLAESGNRKVLLRRAQSGDVDAFAELFEAFRPTVYAVACRLVGETDAGDVVMETYLKAWRSIPGFNGNSSLKTWLFRIAHNCALDGLRARKRHQAHFAPTPDSADGIPVEWPDKTQVSPDENAARGEEERLVRRAMDTLSADHRATLLLRFVEGLSYAEIAAATDVSIGTVMSRIFHGRRKLQLALASLPDLQPDSRSGVKAQHEPFRQKDLPESDQGMPA